MLKIENLHATVGGSQDPQWDQSGNTRLEKCMPLWGRTVLANRHLSYVLSGRDGYEVTQGSADMLNGVNLFES